METDFARRVRQARQQRGLSLEMLAELSGVSRASLSKIEREDRNPSLNAAVQIAEALRVPLGELVGQCPEPAFEVVRDGKAPRVIDEVTKVQRESLLALRHGTEVIRYTLPAGAASEHFAEHEPGTREGFVVLNGRIEITSGEDTVELEAGDAAILPGDRTHHHRNTGKEEARLLIIISPPR